MSSAPRSPKRPLRSSTDCAICFQAYDLETHIPVMGTCGHTICAACRSFLPKKCHICQKENSFENEVKNFSVVEMIEEKLSETKRQKTDPGCSFCQKPVDDADCHVCLACIQKKKCATFENLMEEMGSFKMCSRCAEAIQKHDGHESHKLCDAKSGLYSMDLTLDVELLAKITLPRLGEFQTTCEIVKETYKRFYKTCLAKGRMVGSENELDALKKSMFEDVVRLHKTLMTNNSNLWKLTNECLETMEAITKEKEKLQGRKFTPAENITFRALLSTTRDDDSSDEEVEVNVTTKDWKKMTFEEKKAKALEMLQERGASDEDEEGAPVENEGGTE